MKTTVLFMLLALLASPLLRAAENPIALVIHGGAGTIEKSNMTPAREKAYRDKLRQALDAGYGVLEGGGRSMDAVIAAIQVMESSPLFNAGKGAVYTYDGHHELDASVMDGKTRQAGAVAGVRRIESPIALARMVMEDSPFVMLAGEGAETFAETQGIPLVDNRVFDTPRRLKQLQKAKEKLQREKRQGRDDQAAVDALPTPYKTGTVGAVALDRSGNLAAGTSTGGMTAKRYGRIGDSPVIGAGTFADNDSCAVSATGHGEYFIRYNVAADICARVRYRGQSVVEAADTVINDLLGPVGGTGGVIVLDPRGGMAQVFNTRGMYRASRSSSQPARIAIFDDEA